MKLSAKQKECFKPHAVMHSLFGLGLGILLVTLVPSLAMMWLGLGIMAVAVVLDATRK